MKGTVTRVDAKACRVDVDGRDILCRLRGKLHTRSQGQRRPLAAGDRVEVRLTGEDEGVVERVEERWSKLSRPAADTRGEEQVVAANVDCLLIVISVREPPLRRGLLDRLLVTAEREGLEPFVILNKTDLLEDGESMAEFLDLYRGLGYPVLECSAAEDRGIEPVRDALRGKSSVVVGQSGVGKSTILNAVQPGLRLRTGEVSTSTTKGRHTTTAAMLVRLDIGGYVVDTPGVREFGLWDVPPEFLGGLFPEIEPYIGQCKYRGCTHTHEPDCVVKDAVGDTIDEERFTSYERILESLTEEER